MSAWRIVVKRLYSLGGVADVHQLICDGGIEKGAVYIAKNYGLLQKGEKHCQWVITDKGVAFCEGKIVPYCYRCTKRMKRNMKWRSTWLASLPIASIYPSPQLEFMF